MIPWQDNNIRVTAILVPRFLWSTASIHVFVGSACVLRTGGQLKITGTCSSEFTGNGVLHRAEIVWGRGVLFSFPYRLSIDGAVVSESRVKVSNWPLTFVLPGILLFALFSIFIFLTYVLRTAHPI
jgi:hypothetical protein